MLHEICYRRDICYYSESVSQSVKMYAHPQRRARHGFRGDITHSFAYVCLLCNGMHKVISVIRLDIHIC